MARHGRRTPEVSPELKEVLNMLRALEDQPADEASLEEARRFGRTVITD